MPTLIYIDINQYTPCIIYERMVFSNSEGVAIVSNLGQLWRNPEFFECADSQKKILNGSMQVPFALLSENGENNYRCSDSRLRLVRVLFC